MGRREPLPTQSTLYTGHNNVHIGSSITSATIYCYPATKKRCVRNLHIQFLCTRPSQRWTKFRRRTALSVTIRIWLDGKEYKQSVKRILCNIYSELIQKRLVIWNKFAKIFKPSLFFTVNHASANLSPVSFFEILCFLVTQKKTHINHLAPKNPCTLVYLNVYFYFYCAVNPN